MLEARTLAAVPALLAEVERLQAGGKHLAGWFAYEAGFAFHPALAGQGLALPREPLAWIGVFGAPTPLSQKETENLFSPGGFRGRDLKLTPKESPRAFARAFSEIQRRIARGDVYQINHTFRLEGRLAGSARHLYAELRRAQPVPYGAFIDTGAWRVLSLSPELFLARRGRLLAAKPMKGTARSGRTWDEMEAGKAALASDPKNRAENLMITDLMRNDVARIARPGSVRVRRPFHVERFGRVLQMTSEVRGELAEGAGFAKIFSALFPCGSVTGAPKVRAMEIIAATEAAPRGIYTGALGHWAPGGDFTLNVPIRTLVLDKEGRGRFGTGSGIVADSAPEGEYEECLLKARFLSETPPPFALIETLLWRRGRGVVHLDAHLERMAASARYFGFACDDKKIREALRAALRVRNGAARRRVRVTCDRLGNIAVETKPYAPPRGPVRVALAGTKIDSADAFLYHKTTRRGVYEKAWRPFAGLRDPPYDVLLVNERAEVTEGTFNNVFVALPGGRLATPPLQSGLLPGILRRRLLTSGRAVEQTLTPGELRKAGDFFVGNSVAGLLPARWL